MATLNNIINLLNMDNAEIKEMPKGRAICFNLDHAGTTPVIYEDGLKDLSDEEAIQFIKETLERTEEISTDEVINQVIDTANFRVGVISTDKVQEGMVVRPTKFDGISEYIYSKIKINGGDGKVKISSAQLETIGTDDSEAFDVAESNTWGEISIADLGEKFNFLPTGIMTIVSNKSSCDGAVHMLHPDIVQLLKDKTGWEHVTILPSSIHEVIAVERNDNLPGKEDLIDMITSINGSELRPNEVLAYSPYDLY